MVGYSKIEDRGECLHEQTAATKRTLTQQEHNDTYLLMIQCSMATCGTNQMRVAGTNTTGDGRHKARTVAIPKRTTTWFFHFLLTCRTSFVSTFLFFLLTCRTSFVSTFLLWTVPPIFFSSFFLV